MFYWFNDAEEWKMGITVGNIRRIDIYIKLTKN